MRGAKHQIPRDGDRIQVRVYGKLFSALRERTGSSRREVVRDGVDVFDRRRIHKNGFLCFDMG